MSLFSALHSAGKALYAPLLGSPALPPVYSEAYRALRTNLNFLTAQQNAHSFLVTSAVPEEGAGTAAVNLALSFAADGKRVLLVDGDLRRPSVGQAFSLPENVPGLAELLLGKAQPAQVIRESTTKNLFLLPARPVVQDAAELLDRPEMTHLLAEARQQYDVVILTAPPASVVSDAAILGRCVDGAVLVVRSGHAPREAVLLAKQRLEAVQVRIFGVVLTDFDSRRVRKSSPYAHLHRYEY